MYEVGTILELKEQKPDVVIPAKEDPDTGRKRPKQTIPFPYNRVRVVGQSPINHGVQSAEWSGSGATGVIIEPLSSFEANLDEPFGKLQKLYKVVEMPPDVIEPQPVRVVNRNTAQAGPTPEEVFEADAAARGLKKSPTRQRTRPESPLGTVENESAKGPLD